ncbi:helix-turn-helix domain-containing protein [Georgenia sp. 311]|uniref:transcriptional regulator n=1 Tax=Georgenia sp. 311 TaxID=2585134 RepID=UPI001112316C|nr:transcriptional regulator [Georgenia sp. 311]TNC17205.1 helix-turn-helix domain-containing protein [Georgenia sp. 311]
MSSAVAGFNAVIHPEQRIRICAFLLANEEAAFSVLRESLSISESGLSKQVKVLVDAGYVRATKERGVSRPRTWVALTAEGRRATVGHLAALREIAAVVESS